AEAVALDLRKLVALRAEIAAEHAQLKTDGTTLAEERQRIELLLTQKQKARTESAKALEEQRAKVAKLAEQATDLKELIARSEREVAGAAAAAEAARRSDAAQAAKPTRPSTAPPSLGGSDR